MKQPPDEYMVRHYRFETGILRVNRLFYNDAWSILYRKNHFVTVSSNWEKIIEHCYNHQLAVLGWAKPEAVAGFKVRSFEPCMLYKGYLRG